MTRRETIDAFVRTRGPYAYHVIFDQRNVPLIERHGLVPASQLAQGDRRPWGRREVQSRPGCVYLAAPKEMMALYARGYRRASGDVLVRVDVRRLDVERMVADEDIYWNQEADPDDLPQITTDMRYENPHMTVPDTYLAAQDEYAHTMWKYRSYGEWADRNDVGHTGEELAISLNGYQESVAYLGVIPADLCEFVTMNRDESVEPAAPTTVPTFPDAVAA
jgi:hypothetical protein